jgi:hypothetical protein
MLTHDHLCHEGIYILSACNAVWQNFFLSPIKSKSVAS